MLKIMFPGVAMLLAAFGIVGLLVGMPLFDLAGIAGVLLAVYGFSCALFRTRRAAYLRRSGILVEARLDRIKRDVSYWNTGAYRAIDIICVCVSPEQFNGQIVHTGMFIDYDNLSYAPPSSFNVKIDPNYTKRYYVDLTDYGIPASRIRPFRMVRSTLLFASISAAALGFGVYSSLQAGLGTTALTPERANGTVIASGSILHDWSMKANDCASGAVDGFHGVYLFNSQSPDQRITLIDDRVEGDKLDADIPGQGRHFRFSPAECKLFTMKLTPMKSIVNTVTNLQGSLDADCAADGASLIVHATFQTCH